MASAATLLMLAAHPEWIAPRSDLRVFLGEPGGPEAYKTTVEPGNSFSPGMGSFGVTWWLRVPATGAFFAPELAPLSDLQWRYQDGALPILTCQTTFADLQITHRLLQDGTLVDGSEAVCSDLALQNTTDGELEVQCFVVLRSFGPAGWPIPELRLSDDRQSILDGRGYPLLTTTVVPDGAGCGVGDPSALARGGTVPEATACADADGWCYAVLRYDLVLPPQGQWSVQCECPLPPSTMAHEVPGVKNVARAPFEARAIALGERWHTLLRRTQIDVPNADFVNAYYAGLQHMLTAMVGTQVHIAPLAYPLPWLRDGVMIIRCLELAGFHELAQAATEWCIKDDFFGGFGPEGDAPGQGIWSIVEHYRFSRDKAWLTQAYPALQRKVAWLWQMRRTTVPLRVEVSTPLLAFMQRDPASGMVCVAAQDGLIWGIMDHGVEYALGWVNHWALCGLREAVFAAQELGEDEDAQVWEQEADELQRALVDYATTHADFFAQERTVNSLLWPTGAWQGQEAVVRAHFLAWWERVRGSAEAFQPEPYWLYFEFAQAHNALLLGQPEIARQVIDYRLAHQDLPGLYGWREGGDGVGMENALQGVSLLPHLRGCQRFDAVTPHGWSQAEFWLLQRATLVEEWGEGLLLLAGIPEHWLASGQHIRLEHFPTAYGSLSLEASGESDVITVTIAGIRAGTPLTLRIPGCAETVVFAEETEMSLSLQR